MYRLAPLCPVVACHGALHGTTPAEAYVILRLRPPLNSRREQPYLTELLNIPPEPQYLDNTDWDDWDKYPENVDWLSETGIKYFDFCTEAIENVNWKSCFDGGHVIALSESFQEDYDSRRHFFGKLQRADSPKEGPPQQEFTSCCPRLAKGGSVRGDVERSYPSNPRACFVY